MGIEIFLWGVLAAAIWGIIWYHAILKSPLRLISPISLLSLGMFFYYIVPSIYWSFREWTYYLPPYLDGLPLVLENVIIFGLPFLGYTIFCGKKVKAWDAGNCFLKLKNSGALWLIIGPALIGILIRIYFIKSGWVARLGDDFPILFDSFELTMILYNFTYYIASSCFIFILFGNKKQCRAGWILWGIEGLLRLLTFQRQGIIRFIFLSFVLWTIKGGKITATKLAYLSVCVLFVLSIVGASQHFVRDRVETNDTKYMTIEDIMAVLCLGLNEYSSNTIQENHISEEKNFLLKSLDDAMYRMYDARSASAAMAAMPASIPFYYGETFLNIFYSFVPRYFWGGKPNMASVHNITDEVMYPETGNPLGTIAEFYLNYGYIAVFLGGFVFLIICNFFSFFISCRKNYIWPAFICTYPIFSEQLIYASFNASQRICEIFRGFIVVGLIAGILWIFKIKQEEAPEGKN
jgi:hypothetical protein